jgi:hypothetical protein
LASALPRNSDPVGAGEDTSAAVQRERSGEGKYQPQQPARNVMELLRRGIEGEAEQQQNHNRKREGGVESFLGAKLRAQILGGDGERRAQERGQASVVSVGAVEPACVVEHLLSALPRKNELAAADQGYVGGNL